jgi:cyanophycinase-like exopeptidase
VSASVAQVMVRAEQWARALGSPTIDPDHVGLALAEVDAPTVEAAGVDPLAWVAQTMLWLGYQRGAVGVPPPPPCRTGTVSPAPATVALLDAAREEADRNGQEMEVRHILVALLRVDESTAATHARELGATAAAARRVFGLMPYRRPLAEGIGPDAAPRPSRPRLVLLSGGLLVKALPAALAEAQRLHGTDIRRVGVVGAANPLGGESTARRLRTAGVDAIDLEVDSRRAANASSIPPDIDAVYLPGGDPARGYDALWATRFYGSLVEFAEDGGVVMGQSAGATIWGAGHASWFVSEGDLEPIPMFGWLPHVVVAHHRADGRRLTTAQRLFPGTPILALAHEGAVVVDGDVVRALVDGEVPTIIADSGGEVAVHRPGGAS